MKQSPAKIPFWKTVGSAYGTVFHQLPTFFRLSWLLVVISYGINFGIAFYLARTHQNNPQMIGMIGSLAQVMAISIFAVSWHRLILLNETHQNRWGYLTFGKREVLFAIISILFVVISAVVKFSGLRAGMVFFGPVKTGAIVPVILVPVILSVVFAIVAARFALIFPRIALDKDLKLGLCWQDTKNNTFVLFFGNLVATIPLYLVSFLLIKIAGEMAMDPDKVIVAIIIEFSGGILLFGMVAVVAGFWSFSFKALYQSNPESGRIVLPSIEQGSGEKIMKPNSSSNEPSPQNTGSLTKTSTQTSASNFSDDNNSTQDKEISKSNIPDRMAFHQHDNIVVQPDPEPQRNDEPPIEQNLAGTFTNPSEITREKESEFFAKALKEIEDDKKDPADWARAFSEADGETEKAKALYIKQRVATLTDKFIAEKEDRLEAEEEERRVRLEAEEEERRVRIKAEEEERRRLGEEQIGTEVKARNILRNLGYKYDLKMSGGWVLNDEVKLADDIELFSYLIGLKSELPDDDLIQRLRIAKRLTIIQTENNTFEVQSGSGNLTFNSPSELREYAIRVLFMEDD